MDPLTWLSLGLQLAALCSIVGALLLYLLRKVRVAEVLPADSAKTVLVTSVDTALGLQIATYLSGKGWRVIAGCRQGGLGARLADSWLQAHAAATPEDQPPPRLATLELDVAREDLLEEAARATAQHLPAGEHGKCRYYLIFEIHPGYLVRTPGPRSSTSEDQPPPRLATLELDVAREDLLEEAARATAQHLPAGEHGIWAVINTAGSSGRGGASCWESALRGNVLGALRVARTFSPLLAAAAADHPHAGRLFYIGLTSDTACESLSRVEAGDSETSAGAAAVRWGTWGAARALRASLRARRLHVVLLHAPDLSAAEIYAPPVQLVAPSQPASRPETPSSDVSTASASCAVTMPGEAAEYSAKVLPTSALKVLEDALTAPAPRDSYYLKMKHDSWFTRMPSLRVA